MEKEQIRSLIDAQADRTALEQAFYSDYEIYQRDIEEIFLQSWLYAGHMSEIPKVGDWFLFELAGESIIIVRAADNKVNALVNVCRHRGSRICLEDSGCSKRLVCRYHGWSYDLEGDLQTAAHMDDDFDKSAIVFSS